MFPSLINSILHLLTLSSTCHLVPYCSVLWSSKQPSLLVTDSKNMFKRSVLEYSILIFCFVGNGFIWFFIFYFLAFAPRQYIAFPNRNMFLNLLRNLSTHLLKIKINLFLFLYCFSVLHCIAYRFKNSNRLVRHNLPLKKLVNCLFSINNF